MRPTLVTKRLPIPVIQPSRRAAWPLLSWLVVCLSASNLPAARHTLHWENVPLRRALTRLADASAEHVLIDRRVDPNQPVSLAIENEFFGNIVEKVAQQQGLAVGKIGDLWYVARTEDCDDLQTVIAMKSSDLASSFNRHSKLHHKANLAWPRLSTPLSQVHNLLAEAQIRLADEDLIPYDLWPAGSLPKLTITQALSILLIGFDLTYEVSENPNGTEIKIIPLERPVTMLRKYPLPANNSTILQQLESRVSGVHVLSDRNEMTVKGNWRAHQEVLAILGNKPARKTRQQTPQAEKQVFTLRVRDQQLDLLINHLAKQLGLEITWDQAAIAEAGLSTSKRVSFSVNKVELAELLNAALGPAGLGFRQEAKNIHIVPQAVAQ